MAGGRASFDHFRDLVQLLLDKTVMAPNQHVRSLSRTGETRDVRTLGGMGGPTDPVRLRDGRWLRIAFTLELVPNDGTTRLKVRQSSFQYQEDQAGTGEIFRYDYLRHTSDDYPRAHLNIHGKLLVENALPADKPLAKVHFPTDRVSLEAVLRLLIVDFGVPSALADADDWRKLLDESERTFREIAHRP